MIWADPEMSPLYLLWSFGLRASSMRRVLIASDGVTAKRPSERPAMKPAKIDRGRESLPVCTKRAGSRQELHQGRPCSDQHTHLLVGNGELDAVVAQEPHPSLDSISSDEGGTTRVEATNTILRDRAANDVDGSRRFGTRRDCELGSSLDEFGRICHWKVSSTEACKACS